MLYAKIYFIHIVPSFLSCRSPLLTDFINKFMNYCFDLNFYTSEALHLNIKWCRRYQK